MPDCGIGPSRQRAGVSDGPSLSELIVTRSPGPHQGEWISPRDRPESRAGRRVAVTLAAGVLRGRNGANVVLSSRRERVSPGSEACGRREEEARPRGPPLPGEAFPSWFRAFLLQNSICLSQNFYRRQFSKQETNADILFTWRRRYEHTQAQANTAAALSVCNLLLNVLEGSHASCLIIP